MNDKKVIDGDNITEIRTIGSMYADGRVEVWVKYARQPYMMKVEELLKLVKGKHFGIEVKRKYGYLFNLDK